MINQSEGLSLNDLVLIRDGLDMLQPDAESDEERADDLIYILSHFINNNGSADLKFYPKPKNN